MEACALHKVALTWQNMDGNTNNAEVTARSLEPGGPVQKNTGLSGMIMPQESILYFTNKSIVITVQYMTPACLSTQSLRYLPLKKLPNLNAVETYMTHAFNSCSQPTAHLARVTLVTRFNRYGGTAEAMDGVDGRILKSISTDPTRGLTQAT